MDDNLARFMTAQFVDRPACEICGSEQRLILKSVPFADPRLLDFLATYYSNRIPDGIFENTLYEIRKCRACGFIWQGFVLGDAGMADLYSRWISPTDSLDKKRYAGIELFVMYARECEMVATLLQQKPFKTRVLDFGMGWGYWCSMAKAFGYDVVGFEVSGERLEYARNRGLNVISDLSGLARESLDFINCEQVFEHLPSPLKVLSDVVACLRPGGIIRIAVPDGHNIETVLAAPAWKASKDALHPLEHINCFTHDTLVGMSKKAGLEVLAVRHGPSQGIAAAIAAHVRRLLRRNRASGGTCLYFSRRR